MDELAKAVQKKYIEDITKKYPLHRFLVIFMVIISSYIYSKGDDVRVLSELQNIKLSFIFDFSKGLLASVDFEQLVIAIFVSGIIGHIYSKVSSVSFNLLTKASSFDSYISPKLKRRLIQKNHKKRF
ncbi:hypothetical protein TUMSATVNIG1_25060 [Vibrio nigripulchritudo]|uniref:hypothetical protein n=1 Tax=Vibrio nigripulchritudo TaxID=28173 RepID=UPI0024916F4C|nr:hypothetical protein [Vibrio nigripulchritudo]BDU31897.1 hypothetical protein TUMSATVNIG1_25060 [Vibrio nigripulchritudo]